jgi:flagellar hook protein FlgE
LGDFYKNSSNDKTVTYGTLENSSYATLMRSMDIKSSGDLDETQKEVLNSMFGLDVDSLTFKPGEQDYSYILSQDGVSGLTLYTNTYRDEVKNYDNTNYRIVSDPGDSKIVFNDKTQDSNVSLDLSRTQYKQDIPQGLRDVYNLKAPAYPTTAEYIYSINPTTGQLTITTKTSSQQTVKTPIEDLAMSDFNQPVGKVTVGTTVIDIEGDIEQNDDIAQLLNILPGDLEPTSGGNNYTYRYKITENQDGSGTVTIIPSKVNEKEENISVKSGYTFQVENGFAVYTLSKDNKKTTFELSGDLLNSDPTSIDLLKCYGLGADAIPAISGNTTTYTYKYNIDPSTGVLTIHVSEKVKSSEDAYTNKNDYSVYMNTGSNIVFKNYKSEVETAIPLNGNIATLTNSMKNVLNAIYGYTPGNDDVTYTISDDGTKLTVGTRNNTGVKNYGITQTTTETQLTFEIDEDETTATYRNASQEGKVIYDKIPRTGYGS